MPAESWEDVFANLFFKEWFFTHFLLNHPAERTQLLRTQRILLAPVGRLRHLLVVSVALELKLTKVVHGTVIVTHNSPGHLGFSRLDTADARRSNQRERAVNERGRVRRNHQVANELLTRPLDDEWRRTTLESLFVLGSLLRIFPSLNLLRANLSAPLQ